MLRYSGSMTNFFQHAPAQETYQKRFLEVLMRRRHVIASFPLNMPVVSMYALPALMGSGLTVVICPGAAQIRRNLEYFKGAGFKFPEVAYLDGTQMPHEERAIEKEINRRQVRLLYITPERFSSLTFLELFVHADVPHLIIEEAERLLPTMPGHGSYKGLCEEGLFLLGKLPTLVLLVPPVPSVRFRELQALLRLPDYQTCRYMPLMEGVEIRVQRLFTEYQKLKALISALSGNPPKGHVGRMDGAGAVLIQTAYPAQAEKLGGTLVNYGFEHVRVTHYKKSPREQAQVSEIAGSQADAIIVNAGLEPRFWNPPPEAKPRIVFWSPPAGLDDLLVQVFRQSPMTQGSHGEHHHLKALILHTREDLEAAHHRLRGNPYLGPGALNERHHALGRYREWVLSEACRLQTLAGYYEGADAGLIPPCGRCDCCLESAIEGNSIPRRIRHAVRRWVF